MFQAAYPRIRSGFEDRYWNQSRLVRASVFKDVLLVFAIAAAFYFVGYLLSVKSGEWPLI